MAKKVTSGALEFDGENLYIVRNGVRIAMRKDKAWTAIEPGYQVYDSLDGSDIVLEYSGVSVQ